MSAPPSASPSEAYPLATPGPDLFKLAAGHWATGVAIITTIDGAGQPFGLTMSAITSLSLDPMQFLICVDKRSATLPAMTESGLFCINILGQGQDQVCWRFASKEPDKFNGVAYRRSSSGLPVIEGGLGFIACKVNRILPGGDHEIVVGDVIEIEVPGGQPLIHFQGRFREFA